MHTQEMDLNSICLISRAIGTLEFLCFFILVRGVRVTIYLSMIFTQRRDFSRSGKTEVNPVGFDGS